MNDSRRPFGATEPEPIDDNEDRMGSMETLDFDEEEPAVSAILSPEGELQHEIPDQRVREAGLTGASTDDHHSTDDDLSPETLIHEDGARSPNEPGEDLPADPMLRSSMKMTLAVATAWTKKNWHSSTRWTATSADPDTQSSSVQAMTTASSRPPSDAG